MRTKAVSGEIQRGTNNPINQDKGDSHAFNRIAFFGFVSGYAAWE
jgi:hypothetical protein